MTAAAQFDLDNGEAYRAWRAHKLASHPRDIGELLVSIGDPRALSATERALTLDGNYLADDDGITPIAVADQGTRTAYIPYTTRPIKWHTDGYYNPPVRQVRGMVLHCVRPAASGGENALMDHEIAYILLRDENPGYIRALMAPDAMTIPSREEEGEVARGDQPGPVFSVDDSGCLHMRYTARTRSIVWKEDDATRSAVKALEAILASDSPYIFRGRLEPGMGLVCNNVLHDRAAFTETPQQKRLYYRARYYERVSAV
ncbi:MAG: hypothetical protein H6R12_1463 [Proteobacteria bacterium]|nr:hypothetical protein [Pseudomonadota bacterium]